MRYALALLALIPSLASSAGIDKETRIRKWVQLQIAISQSDYCGKEFDKLLTKSETPFMLDQRDPSASNQRFSANKLTLEEEIAYKEFTNYCAASFAVMKSLSDELNQK